MNTESQLKATYQSLIREQSGVPLPDDEQQVKQREQKTENEVIKRTLVVQWMRDGVTQEMFRDINNEIESLETLARDKASGYHVNQNHMEIINLLVRAAELRKLKDKYASNS